MLVGRAGAAAQVLLLAGAAWVIPAVAAESPGKSDPVAADAPVTEPALAFSTDRAPVALVLDSIGAMLGLTVVIDGDPQALISGTIRGSLAEALGELQGVEPLVFDVHQGELHVVSADAAVSERLANDVTSILPISAVLSLGSPLPANRIQSDVSGTRVSGHPAFVTRTVQGLRALLSMRGLAIVDDPDGIEPEAASAALGASDSPLEGLESIPGFNTLPSVNAL